MGAFLDGVYARSPAFVQSLGITAFSFKQRLAEYGKAFRRRLETFEENQWLSAGELRELQNERLRVLVRHCYDNVPYYRSAMERAKLTPDDLRTADDLPKLPLLTSEDIRNNYETLIARGSSPSSLYAGFTSGTTGAPLKLFYDRSAVIAKNAIHWRQKSAAGLQLGDRMAQFWGRILIPAEQSKPPFWRYNWTFNQLFCSSYHVSAKNLDAYVDEMRRFGVKAIEGYPSTLHAIARHMLERKTTLPLAAVFPSSETLFPEQRADMQRAFECPVFDYYGMAERVVFATECEHHRGMHLNSDYGITEIVDGNGEPQPTGRLGRIVGTGLYNFGMPLLRYRTNDATSIAGDACSCGRGFPLMGEVASRTEQIVTTPDGRHLSFASLSLPFKTIASIEEAQIVQEDREHLAVNLVRRESWRDEDGERLRAEFVKRIGEQMEIELNFVDRIPRTRSGKLRFVISKVEPDF